MARYLCILYATALLMNITLVHSAQAESMRIGYLRHWPTPNQFAQADDTLGKQLNIPVIWKGFDTGIEISDAIEAGEVDIAYSQGVAPFVKAVSDGLPIKTIGIAVSYAENDNCIVHYDAEINQGNAIALEGQKVAVPLGTVPHYKLLRMLSHLNVDHTKITLLDLTPNEAADALANAEVVMACGFGGGYIRMLEHGDLLMNTQELADIGIFVFDIVAVTDSFAEKHPEWVQAFLQQTEDNNRNFVAEPQKFYDILAGASELSREATIQQLDHFIFPQKSEVLNRWFTGNVASFFEGVAQTMHEAGFIAKPLSSYKKTINRHFLEAIN